MIAPSIQVLVVVCYVLCPQVGARSFQPLQNIRRLLNNLEKTVTRVQELPLPDITRRGDVREKCYEELGCLVLDDSWYDLTHRPINVFPASREVIDVRFLLNNRITMVDNEVLKPNNIKTIKRSRFRPGVHTTFIVHGYLDNGRVSWVNELTKALLKHKMMNVIAVDWSGGSFGLYSQATANTRLVGLEIANLIVTLIKHFSIKPEQIHIIGHSLGSHIAGYAGEKIPGLGRISGLDPAEPYFQGMPSHVRLDPSDAKFVDVIHTDGTSIFLLGLGMHRPCGHVDFYPNKGQEQPGCDLGGIGVFPLTTLVYGLQEAYRDLIACNHLRAIKLYTESINSRCQFFAYKCVSYEEFLKGNCHSCKDGSGCARLGYHADKYKPHLKGDYHYSFYLLTNDVYPYCRFHYRMDLALSKPFLSSRNMDGFLTLKYLNGNNSSIKNVEITPNGINLSHGRTYTFILTSRQPIGEPKSVRLHWQNDRDLLSPSTICISLQLCSDKLYIKYTKITAFDLLADGSSMTTKNSSSDVETSINTSRSTTMSIDLADVDGVDNTTESTTVDPDVEEKLSGDTAVTFTSFFLCSPGQEYTEIENNSAETLYSDPTC